MNKNEIIVVDSIVNVPVEKAWKCWTEPEHIMKWAFASDTWEAPAASNDLRVGGTFSTTMAAKDGSTRFDFNGVYTVVHEPKRMEYTMEDGRKVSVEFQSMGDKTKVVESFEMEHENSRELQQAGWQAILENFKKHAESCS